MRISVKRIIFVSLLVLVGVPCLLIALLVGSIAYDGWQMGKGNYPLADRTEARIATATLVLERYAIHPFLAEYKRILTVTDATGAARRLELPIDSGGGDMMLACGGSAGGLQLLDRFGAYGVIDRGVEFDAPGVVLSQNDMRDQFERVLTDRETIPCYRYLGRFDRDSDRHYGFEAAEETGI